MVAVESLASVGTSFIDRSRWETVRFGDVVCNVNDNEHDPESIGIERYVGLEHIDPESLHISRWGLVADGTSFTRVFRTGQVLFGKRRAYQRKITVAEWDGICSGDILVFEPLHDRLLPELLPFIVQSDGFFEHALGTSAGSLSPRTRWKDLAAYEFALPPKHEQRRIAEVLWAADSVVSLTEAVIQEANKLSRTVFEDWLREGLEDKATSNTRWPLMSLGDLLLCSPEGGYSAPSVDGEGEAFVLALSALTPNGYRAGELKPVRRTPEVEAALLRQGDFLISRSNTIDFVGYCGIFDEPRDDVSFPDTMMRLTPDESIVRKRFLERVLQSQYGRAQIRRMAAGTSASLKKINRRNLATVQIPVPTLATQAGLLETVESIEARASAACQHHECSQQLRRALLGSLLG